MSASFDSAALSPEERLHELGRLFAIGLLRLPSPIRSSESRLQSDPEISRESSPNELVVSHHKSVTGQAG